MDLNNNEQCFTLIDVISENPATETLIGLTFMAMNKIKAGGHAVFCTTEDKRFMTGPLTDISMIDNDHTMVLCTETGSCFFRLDSKPAEAS